MHAPAGFGGALQRTTLELSRDTRSWGGNHQRQKNPRSALVRLGGQRSTMSLLWLTAFGFRAVAASASVSTEARTSPLRSCAEVQGQPEPPLLFDVPHDGNCLFSAVALSVAIVDDAPAQTRARAVRTAAARLRSAAMDLLCPHGSPDPELSFGGLP
eukprot:scaffold111928_cov63-Phaeocystis_antarctica.AAC.3